MHASLLALLPEDALVIVLGHLWKAAPRSFARLLVADRLRDASEGFWRGLADVTKVRMPPHSSRPLRSTDDPRRTFIAALSHRRELLHTPSRPEDRRGLHPGGPERDDREEPLERRLVDVLRAEVSPVL